MLSINSAFTTLHCGKYATICLVHSSLWPQFSNVSMCCSQPCRRDPTSIIPTYGPEAQFSLCSHKPNTVWMRFAPNSAATAKEATNNSSGCKHRSHLPMISILQYRKWEFILSSGHFCLGRLSASSCMSSFPWKCFPISSFRASVLLHLSSLYCSFLLHKVSAYLAHSIPIPHFTLFFLCDLVKFSILQLYLWHSTQTEGIP